VSIDNKVAGALGQPFLGESSAPGLSLYSHEQIVPSEPPTEEARIEAASTNHPIRKKQIFVDLDMKMWQEAIEICEPRHSGDVGPSSWRTPDGLTESIIPTREAPAAARRKAGVFREDCYTPADLYCRASGQGNKVLFVLWTDMYSRPS
jgi:hypothetical protein